MNNQLELDELQVLAPAVFATGAAKNVTEKYEFFPTIDIVNDLAALGWYPVSAQQQRRSKMESSTTDRKPLSTSTARHLIRFEHVDHQEFGDGQQRPQIILVNAHDRTASIQLYIGIFRFACSNGLIVGNMSSEPIMIRHQHYSFEYVRTSIQKMVTEFQMVEQYMDAMKNTIITDEERKMDLALEFIACRYDTLSDEEIEEQFDVAGLLIAMREEDAGDTLWNLMNIAQEKLLAGGSALMRFSMPSRAKKGQQRTAQWKNTKGISQIKKSVKLNKAIWNTAMSYMEAPEA